MKPAREAFFVIKGCRFGTDSPYAWRASDLPGFLDPERKSRRVGGGWLVLAAGLAALLFAAMA